MASANTRRRQAATQPPPARPLAVHIQTTVTVTLGVLTGRNSKPVQPLTFTLDDPSNAAGIPAEIEARLNAMQAELDGAQPTVAVPDDGEAPE